MEKNFVRTEIGSEFWDVPMKKPSGAPLPADTQWFICGTSALRYIIQDIQKNVELKQVGIPSWCCSCMIEPFVDAGISVAFYPVYVDEAEGLTCDYEAVAECDATLILSYFGYESLKTKGHPGGILIRDLTHSLFGRKYEDAQYYFGSLRKWAGFWTGGYAWKKEPWNLPQSVLPADVAFLHGRDDAMTRKLEYLTGMTDSKAYLEQFEDLEDFLDHCGIMGSCERDIHCARKLDAAFVKTRRRENALVLLSYFKDMAVFPEMQEHDCPMFVPILLPNKEVRDNLRRYLISKEIYCPIHWPISELHQLGAKERELYDRGLSLVCDQRYDTADMMRIVDAIHVFMG